MIHSLSEPFVIEEAANPRFGDASIQEVRRSESTPLYHGFYRVIGGDAGDLLFDGYSVEKGKTILCNPAVNSNMADESWSEEDWNNLAREIFNCSYASIGIECVEHS